MSGWVIFDQWQKLHLGLDALSNQKILNGIYYLISRNKKEPNFFIEWQAGVNCEFSRQVGQI